VPAEAARNLAELCRRAAAAPSAASGLSALQRVRVEWDLLPTPSDDRLACP
jgi:hypothetical protein